MRNRTPDLRITKQRGEDRKENPQNHGKVVATSLWGMMTGEGPENASD